MHHGPAKFLLLRQPGYPRHLGPVAFRPLITQGLALSAIFCLLNLAYYLAILVPNQVNELNQLIS